MRHPGELDISEPTLQATCAELESDSACGMRVNRFP